MPEELTQELNQEGAFIQSLKRNNRQIKDDRARAISEDTEIALKRSVEDLGIRIKRLKRQRENMLDLSPENTTSLKLANNFDAQAFADEDLRIGVEIRDLAIKHNIAAKRYNYLFNGNIQIIEEEK